MSIAIVSTSTMLLAQDTTQTTVRPGTASTTTTVERGEVVYVSGNDLVIKMDTGEIRHMTVPDTARATVEGKDLSVHDLKPGMKLQRTISTTTTPKAVTSIRTIQGTVFAVIAPSTLILSFPEGGNKQYNIPKDQKFVIDGKSYTAFELKKGMKVGATVVTETNDTSVTETRRTTGTAAAPPPPPPPPPVPVTYVGVLLIEVAAPVPPPPPPTGLAATPARATTAPEPAPKALPKTASPLPLVGLLGILFCAASLGMRTLRRAGRSSSV